MSYFLTLGGLSTSAAFDASVLLSGVMLIGNMFGWVFVERFGRRGTGLWGECHHCKTEDATIYLTLGLTYEQVQLYSQSICS